MVKKSPTFAEVKAAMAGDLGKHHRSEFKYLEKLKEKGIEKMCMVRDSWVLDIDHIFEPSARTCKLFDNYLKALKAKENA